MPYNITNRSFMHASYHQKDNNESEKKSEKQV